MLDRVHGVALVGIVSESGRIVVVCEGRCSSVPLIARLEKTSGGLIVNLVRSHVGLVIGPVVLRVETMVFHSRSARKEDLGRW